MVVVPRFLASALLFATGRASGLCDKEDCVNDIGAALLQVTRAVKGKFRTNIRNNKAALLVIDVQDCFLDKLTTSGKRGSLGNSASHIIELINSMREEESCLFDKVIFSQDFHPANHISFGSTHGLKPFSHTLGKGGLPLKCVKPGHETAGAACCPTHFVHPEELDCMSQLCPPPGWDYMVNNSGIVANNPACKVCKDDPGKCFNTVQAMWTDHCLDNGDSTFPPSLDIREDDTVVRKGTSQFVDAYSAFLDNTHTYKTELEDVLLADEINTLYVVGIATDFCVLQTVRDAIERVPSVKKVYAVADATAPVSGNETNFNKAIDEMQQTGAKILSVDKFLKRSKRRCGRKGGRKGTVKDFQ